MIGRASVVFPSARLAAALLVFAAVSSVAVVFVSGRAQLTNPMGLAEDHFLIGQRLWRHGEPVPLFRPPGYPLFVAAAIAISGSEEHHGDVQAVQRAQSLLLGASCALLLWWSWGRVAPASAVCLALGLGLNPLMLVLAGFLHYDVLHIFATLLSCWVVGLGMEADGREGVALTLLGGCLSGLGAIIRPTGLFLPLFVFVAFLVRYRAERGRALWRSAVFTAGLCLAIAPLTARNQARTERLIPINVQAGMALWSATLDDRPPLTNSYTPWAKLWWRHGMRLYEATTGCPDYDYEVFKERILELNAAFRARAFENIRREPAVYARNVARNAVFFAVGQPTGMLTRWLAVQPPGEGAGRRHNLASAVAGAGQRIWLYLLTALSLLGVAAAALRKDATILAPAAFLACLWAAHAATFVDFRYLYIKVPFLIVFYGYLSQALRRTRLGMIACVLDWGVAALAVGSAGALFFL